MERTGAGSGIFYGAGAGRAPPRGPVRRGALRVRRHGAAPGGDGGPRAPAWTARTWAPPISLADTASLRELAAVGGREDPLDQRRFRMTIGIDGVRPYAEDEWLSMDVRLGTAVVRPGGNVGRCATTTRDPDTAEPDFDTLRCLADTRGTMETHRAAAPGRLGDGGHARPRARGRSGGAPARLIRGRGTPPDPAMNPSGITRRAV